MTFKDFFSTQANDYAKYRPTYPASLYEYLASIAPAKDLAWDVGTGNGQAAIELAKFFTKVIATDPSEKQLAEAVANSGVEYRCATAEKSGLEAASADLITVAQAFHWFDQPKFFAEVKRVAKPGAALAVWCYELAHVNPEIDEIVMELYRGILGPYWDNGRKLVEEGYRNEKFPFAELKPPPFQMQAAWSSQEMLGYLGTWSALQKYRKEHGRDPRELIFDKFSAAWGEQSRLVSWPLSLRVFRT
ncbi:MAG: class I SAM-dependent methyltransferase [Bdellovibrionota bacterium]